MKTLLFSPEHIELVARITDFHNRYCADLDAGRVENWPDYFCEDALYRVNSRENVDQGLPAGLVYAQGRDMMRDRATAVARTQMFAPRYTLHLVSNVHLLEVGALVRAQANFIALQTLVEGPTTIHMAGRYEDVFRLGQDGRLLLKDRQVVYDTSVVANDLVYPL
jgi:3-phenylpropionate/cinnamic acid dioxygenase small subunit